MNKAEFIRALAADVNTASETLGNFSVETQSGQYLIDCDKFARVMKILSQISFEAKKIASAYEAGGKHE